MSNDTQRRIQVQLIIMFTINPWFEHTNTKIQTITPNQT